MKKGLKGDMDHGELNNRPSGERKVAGRVDDSPLDPRQTFYMCFTATQCTQFSTATHFYFQRLKTLLKTGDETILKVS